MLLTPSRPPGPALGYFEDSTLMSVLLTAAATHRCPHPCRPLSDLYCRCPMQTHGKAGTYMPIPSMVVALGQSAAQGQRRRETRDTRKGWCHLCSMEARSRGQMCSTLPQLPVLLPLQVREGGRVGEREGKREREWGREIQVCAAPGIDTWSMGKGVFVNNLESQPDCHLPLWGKDRISMETG